LRPATSAKDGVEDAPSRPDSGDLPSDEEGLNKSHSSSSPSGALEGVDDGEKEATLGLREYMATADPDAPRGVAAVTAVIDPAAYAGAGRDAEAPAEPAAEAYAAAVEEGMPASASIKDYDGGILVQNAICLSGNNDLSSKAGKVAC
jgi:hypothetical protein